MKAASGCWATRRLQRASWSAADEIQTRVRYDDNTVVSVDIVLPDGTAQRIVSEIRVQDVLIAGMGNSTPQVKATRTGRLALRRGLLLPAL